MANGVNDAARTTNAAATEHGASTRVKAFIQGLLFRWSHNNKHYISGWKLLTPAPLVLLALGMASGSAPAPSGSGAAGVTTAGGVYTLSQANAGKALYGAKCAMCHGAELEGGGAGQNPALAGAAFLGQWKGQSLDDLYTMIQATMPATNPGTLTPDETVQLMSYILEVNHMPKGQKDLSTNETVLKTIQIAKP